MEESNEQGSAGVGGQHQVLQNQGKKAPGLDEVLVHPPTAPHVRSGAGQEQDVPHPSGPGSGEKELFLLGGREGADPGAAAGAP